MTSSSSATTNLLPCPNCGEHDIGVDQLVEQYSAYCEICGMAGPDSHTPEDAAVRWNALPRRTQSETESTNAAPQQGGAPLTEPTPNGGGAAVLHPYTPSAARLKTCIRPDCLDEGGRCNATCPGGEPRPAGSPPCVEAGVYSIDEHNIWALRFPRAWPCPACTALANEKASVPSSARYTASVWSVENKTSRALFATEKAAWDYVGSFPGSVAGGMFVSELPVLGALSATRYTQVGWAKLGTWAGDRYVQEVRRVDQGQSEWYHHAVFAATDRGVQGG
jgi:hypothetical protein